jgi:hypothetical protein
MVLLDHFISGPPDGRVTRRGGEDACQVSSTMRRRLRSYAP